MKTIALFGGTGGIGKKLAPLLDKKYNVISVGSKNGDVTSFEKMNLFFDINDIDIVINMSGKKNDFFLNEIKNKDLDKINKMLNVNINGNINILSNCLPKMREKGWGRIIGISSIFSEMNIPKNAIYSASKSFMDRLYSTANKENIKHGITCNTIQLGYWDGGMGERVEQKYQDIAKSKIGLNRFGDVDELYNTINYIIDNEYFCGSTIKINGGL